MRKYGGTLVFEGRDEMGVIEVIEEGGQRTLHFGTGAKQSSMDLTEPMRLLLTYTQAMTAPLLFQEEPRRVLMVGLGGGSLAKFFLHHFPRCHIDAVELRAGVVQVARRFFHLPETPRLRVTVDDAANFMATAPFGDHADYDLILIDAFVAGGISHAVCGLTFFESCALRLARDGMVAVNLWTRDRVALTTLLESIADGLSTPVWRLPVMDKDNVIALAGRPLTARGRRALGDHARDLDHRFGVDYSGLLKHLRKHNPALL